MKNKPNFVKEVSEHFNGGSADNATLYDIAKFMERVWDDWNKQVKSLEELCSKSNEIIRKSRFISIERSLQDDIKEYLEMVKKFNEQQS